MIRVPSALAFALSLAAAGLAATAAHADGDAANGEKVFKRCMACHTVEAGAPNKIGPNLHGVVGRAAASVDGFRYSDAMKASGVTWDAATLDLYLTKPKDMIPGNKMAFVGLPKPSDRADLIAYLQAQSQ